MSYSARVWPLMVAQRLGVSKHRLEEVHPHLDKCLPGGLDAELGHVRLRCFTQPETFDQALGHLATWETYQLLEGCHHLGLGEGVGPALPAPVLQAQVSPTPRNPSFPSP